MISTQENGENQAQAPQTNAFLGGVWEVSSASELGC